LIEKSEFKEGMRRLAASVCIVTTELDGQKIGCTATAVCSLSDTPPSLMVCLNQASLTGKAVSKSKKLCINICSTEDEATSNLFAKSSNDLDKFQNNDWETTQSGSPRLRSSIAAFDCIVDNIAIAGSHFAITSLIQDISISPDKNEALLYAGGSYGKFSSL